MPLGLFDHRVRLAAFSWLKHQVDLVGDFVLPRKLLLEGFPFDTHQVFLLSPAQGIFKPRIMELPLSITTSPKGPYKDAFGPQHLNYRYRGTDPQHPDNVGLRECMRLRRPLVYFHGVAPGKYHASWPVYVVGDIPGNLTFLVDVDDQQPSFLSEENLAEPQTEIRRQYVTTTTRRRIHQRAFRERVIAAYRGQCALCRLRHENLLEAAHIIPDSDPEGEPVVRNGISFCKLHHAAFDNNILGIRTDYTAEIRLDVLDEIDGPMLKHGLQEMHGVEIFVPSRAEFRPDAKSLETRFEIFRRSA